MTSPPCNKLQLVELQGSFLEMGRQFGEECRDAIDELYQIRLENALKHAGVRGRIFSENQALQVAATMNTSIADFDPQGFEELQGIADGAGISLTKLTLMQGLTDLRDLLSWGKAADGFGCTAVIVSRERSSDGQVRLAQNWDLQTSNMPYVRLVKRKPHQGPHTVSLTVAGGLSMIALNSEGLAVGTNNIKTTDSRAGVHYLNIIHKAMSCTSAFEAASMISRAPRAGAHNYLIADSAGHCSDLECSAAESALLSPRQGIFTHCNHALSPRISKLEAEDMGPSTRHRQKRIDELTASGLIGEAELIAMLADHDGDQLAICRHHVGEGISTNATVIISPEEGQLSACYGHPHGKELFRSVQL